ncbi:MAG: thioredoxin family protein [Ferruginibacter sp.]|nr:thioredoxin family protein [Ferruginibacter sp.]
MYRFFLFVLLIFIFKPAKSQDSSHVHWTYSVKSHAEGHYIVEYKAKIDRGWRLYAYPSKPDEIDGVVVKLRDSSIKVTPPKFQSNPINIEDPVFEKQIPVARDSVSFTQHYELAPGNENILKVALDYYVGREIEFIPESQQLTVFFQGGETTKASSTVTRLKIEALDLNNPVSECGELPQKQSNIFTIFLLGFLGGFIALLTPCVFPMIPLTVSFFTKKATSRSIGIRNAFLYGLFIFLIYVLLSVPFHFIDKLNPEILNNISTNVYLNVAFFVIFIVFAFSFFGFYEIGLPASFSSGADSKANSGKIIGIFFMALTLAIVSFSCTGPILGSLLAGSLSADGGAMQLSAGMAGFGLALALPFALFALFPNWLHSLPKSGGWLSTVKIVLGFLELALAFKFLSNADLVSHWGLLKREIFIGIWILIGLLLTLYLFGFIKFKHEGVVNKISMGRKITGMVVGLFTLYLLPGLTNTAWANLRLISGFPPPLYYSVYAKPSECILGLNCTHDYEEGLAMAKRENKPMLIDFTGYACVNCRRMEENVWTDPEVYKTMLNNYIVVSLYVDDKKQLPASRQFTYTASDGSQKEIVTVGNKWATFQTENFKNNAQPLYAIVDTSERLLTHPVPYTPDAEEYHEWLKCGVESFHKK